jgi:nucleoside-diphosphate-sugar epimerase
MKKKVLITGATSQIGRFLLPIVKNEAYEVYAISRSKQISDDNITWIQSDIESLEKTLDHKLEVEFVIHLAEMTLISKVLDSLNNVKRVIALSSTSAISKINSKNIKDRDLAIGLQLAEKDFIDNCHDDHISWTIFRPTLIYGAGIDQNVAFISRFIEKYSFFPILGEGNGLRQPVHACDLAKACLLSMENKKTFKKTYNLTGAETIKYIDMVRKISQSLNKKVIIIKIPKYIFYIVIKVLNLLPKYKHLTTGMVDRLNADLCFDSAESKNDFNYKPNRFSPNKIVQNDL